MGVVERQFQAVILGLGTVGADLWTGVGAVENLGIVDAFSFPVVDGFAHLEMFYFADHFVDGAVTELRHDLAKFFGDVGHEVHDGIGGTIELFA